MSGGSRVSERAVEWLGLSLGALTIATGVGYAVTPAKGPANELWAPWKHQVTPLIAGLGLAGGLILIAAVVWFARALRSQGRWPGTSGGLAVLLVLGVMAADGLAVRISSRADPPLPPSWDWIQTGHLVALLLGVAWLAAVATSAAVRRTHPAPAGPPTPAAPAA